MRLPDPSFCLGRGKAQEIAGLVKEIGPDKVILNNRLKPVQKYNLTDLFRVEVIDRFQLILEIFGKRAGTIEAKYQIELAKLQYELPMARENVRLAKLGELPGFHGLGKYQADVYTSMIKKRISYLKKRLQEISTRKSMHRQQRRKGALFTVALTGYTFAGKTTLFNRLAGEELQVGKTLFTTLSTTTRAVPIYGRRVLFSDTVGFIDNLPHLLVEAFYSTLEEVTLADLVLLVLDSSDPLAEFGRKLRTCVSTLSEIGVFGGSIVPVLNKIDLSEGADGAEELIRECLGRQPVRISSRTGEGIDDLKDLILRELPPYPCLRISCPATAISSSLVSWAREEAEVRSLRYSAESLEMVVCVHPLYLPKLERLLSRVDGVKAQRLEEKGVEIRR